MITSMKYILAIVLAFLTIDVGICVPLKPLETIKQANARKLSTINVKIRSAPSRDYERVIEHCASILESHWVSNSPTVVKLDFSSFEKETLAYAKPTTYIKVGKYRYQRALARSIPGVIFTSKYDSDVIVNINTKINWYTGIDGHTSAEQFDLVSVCVHEIMHGLYFSGSRNRTSNTRFEAFLTTKTEEGEYCSLKSFESEPKKLKTALTNNELYFSANNRTIAKLSAPNPFAPGSSTFHLDYKKYTGGQEAVMLPAFVKGESRHTIGPVIKEIQAILRDQTSVPPKTCRGANLVKPSNMVDRTNDIIIISCIGISLVMVSLIIALCIYC